VRPSVGVQASAALARCRGRSPNSSPVALVRHQAMGFWWAGVPRERWPDHSEWRESIAKHWDPAFGDRRQELVFIGSGMDEAAMRAALDACLVGPDEAPVFEPRRWARLSDPFPVWRRGEAG